MKTKIPSFLMKQLLNKNARPKFFPNAAKQFIFDYGKYYKFPNKKKLEGNQLLSLWFRYMKSNINEIGICEYEGCSNQNRIVNDSKTNGFLVSRGCCTKHSVKISMLEKYGVENAMDLESFKNKIKQTTLKNHGVENPMHSDKIKNKLTNTMIEKYDTDNIFKKNDFIKSRFKEKYGVENPSQVSEFQEKKKITCMKNYGVENPSQSNDIKEKIYKTNIKRYGTKHPIMLQDTFRTKEYQWKTGEISKVRGYEPIVLKELENEGYTYDQVKTSPIDMPKFTYLFEGNKKRYYPDIFIPNENLIIEVKSEYTMNVDLEKNLLKQQSVKDAGLDFKFEIR